METRIKAFVNFEQARQLDVRVRMIIHAQVDETIRRASVAAALAHHYLLRDDVLRRMLPQRG